MKSLIYPILCLFIVGALSAQPTIAWQKCYGGSEYDWASSLQQTNDGGFIVAGYTRSQDGEVSENIGIFDFWIVKLDTLGSIQWEKSYGGGYSDWATSIKQTNDGGYIVVGYTDSNDGDVSGNHGGYYDAWVIKLSNLGVLEWQKCFGGSGWDEASFVQQTSDGGYIIAGTSGLNDGDITENHGGTDFWAIKLNANGIIEWQKSLGGSEDDRAYSIKETTDGGYIMVGETLSNDGDVSENNGDIDVWVVKLNNSGALEWQNTLGGNALDVGTDVVETNDGFVVCGFVGSLFSGDVMENNGFFDYWIVKLDKTGQLVWQKVYGGSNADAARSIIQTSDGMLLVGGEAKSNDGDVSGNNGVQIAWILKLDQTGSLIWKKPLGGTQGEFCLSLHETVDKEYTMAGVAWSNDGDVTGNHGRADYWVVKLSPETSPTTTPATQTLELYPNPAQNTLSLKIPETLAPNAALSLQITDLLGREVLQKSVFDGGLGSVDLDIAKLPGGLYWVQASSSEGEVFVGKFQKLD